MKMLVSGISIIAAGILTLTAAGVDARSFRIKCDGPWQINGASPHASPYCADTYLARIARSYGMRVSARAVRNNPGVKAEVCRYVGHDTRVMDICVGFRDDRGDDGRDDLR